METNKLKLATAAFVCESKLSKAAKLQMMEFIKTQATDSQLKALMLDGEIVKLDEQAEQIVNDRFAIAEAEFGKNEILKELFEFLGFLDAVGGQLQATYDACRKTKCHKSAGMTRNPFAKAHRACTDLCWVAALQKAKGTLNSGKARCKTARNPEKCTSRFSKLMARYDKGIARYKANAARKMAKK